jgi:Rod binding domain-containing protein
MVGQLLPQALSQGITSTGGLGVAAQIAASIDPALQGKLS